MCLTQPGIFCSNTDLTTDYSATLIALLSTVTMLFGVVTPHIITAILGDQTDLMKSWNRVFNATALVMALGGLMFLLFGSAQNQHWEIEMNQNSESLDESNDCAEPDSSPLDANASTNDRSNSAQSVVTAHKSNVPNN